jgi:hypothetical protein
VIAVTAASGAGMIPAAIVPQDKTPYEAGYEQGRAVAGGK